MIRDVLDFFRREKFYAILLALVVIVYGVLFYAKHQMPEPEQPEILNEYKQAEKRLQESLKDAGSLQQYLKDQPRLVLGINILMLIFIGGGITGLVLGLRMSSCPEARAGLCQDRAPPETDWKFSMLFKFLVWFLVLNFTFSLLAAGVRQILGGIESLYILFHTVMAEFLSFKLVEWNVKGNGGRLTDVGFRVPETGVWREMKLGWAGYCCVLPVFGVVLLVILGISKMLNYEPPPHPLVPMLLDERSGYQIILFCALGLAIILGPAFEEIFFRGFCYPILKKQFGRVWAMIGTSAFFAMIHDNTFAFWPIFVLGLALNILYECRGSLIAPITLHITHNGLFITYFFMAKQVLAKELGG